MESIIELINLLNVGRLKQNGAWSSIIEPGSKMELLFNAMVSGEVQNDESGAKLLYGTASAGSKYLNVKERLRNRLLNSIFLFDFNNNNPSNRHQAYVECNRRWSVAMVLQAKNAKRIAIEELESLLETTDHYEFTELSLSIVSALRLHYGSVQGDSRRYMQYRERFQQLQMVWLRETKAEDLYTHLVAHFTNSKTTKSDISDLAAQYYRDLEADLLSDKTFRLQLCGFLIQTVQWSSINDYRQTAAVCEAAIAFFKSKPFDSNLPQQIFYYQLLVCCIQMREFERGSAIYEDYAALFEEGSFNWLKLQESYFILCMHTRAYEQARETCLRVAPYTRIHNSLPAHIVEMWKIYEAYVQFLERVGKLPESEQSVKFRQARFLNEIPVFSKDKRGMNIPILVLQILFSISDHDYAKTIDRIEAIDKYCGRYLTKGDNFRSNCFIKLLLTIPAASFHREGVLRRSEKLLDQLHSVPLEVAYQTHEIEIIPYEDLWEMVMADLENKIYKRGTR